MAKLDALLAERLARARRYDELVRDLPSIAIPKVSSGCGHTYQSYVIRVLEGGVGRRNAIMDAMATRKIQTRPGTHAVHRLGYYVRKYSLSADQFPNAAACEDTSITLPIFPGMSDADQERVVEALQTTL